MVIKLRWSTNFIPKLCFHYSCCPHTSMQNIILHINREPLVFFKKSFTHAGIQKTLETGGIIEGDERTKKRVLDGSPLLKRIPLKRTAKHINNICISIQLILCRNINLSRIQTTSRRKFKQITWKMVHFIVIQKLPSYELSNGCKEPCQGLQEVPTYWTITTVREVLGAYTGQSGQQSWMIIGLTVSNQEQIHHITWHDHYGN